MFLGRCQNEDNVLRRFLQRLEEGVECSRRQHVYLVDDKHLVLTHLRRNTSLLHQRLDVFDGVVAGSVQIEDVKRTLLIESLTRLTLAAGFAVGSRRQAVNGFCKDTRTGCLTHTTWSTEQVGVGQFPAHDCVLEGRGKRLLSYYRVEGGRTVFSR